MSNNGPSRADIVKMPVYELYKITRASRYVWLKFSARDLPYARHLVDHLHLDTTVTWELKLSQRGEPVESIFASLPKPEGK